MRLLKWIYNNIFFIFTLFLLAFIPLYPKLPLLDVKNTWVYIRLEDFIIAFILVLWIGFLLTKKITLKTPLTFSIILFWIIGAIATIHGVLIVSSFLSNVHSNVAFLNYLRRIEYMSLFFIAYAGIKNKQASIYYIVFVLTVTLICVVGYGLGQKYYGFPAFLTMNEEFAKGTPIYLSSLSRIPSTFAGHYDLAAYLVLILPILTSMIFGFRNWLIKIFLLCTVSLGFWLIFMTVSRVSFFVLFLSLILVLFLQKRKIIFLSIFFIPIILFASINLAPGLLQRFGDTVKEVDVLISARTGEAIGHVTEVPITYFKDKPFKIINAESKDEIWSPRPETLVTSISAELFLSQLPSVVPLVTETNAPSGEDLSHGTGYINLPLSPVIKKTGQFFYQKINAGQVEELKILGVNGSFLIKKTLGYDLSFTTRFQGEWPNAFEAFEKSIFFGSGYSSVSLAVDNNYIRILGEVGLFGFLSFFGIFLVAGIYIKKIFPTIDSPVVKSFILGIIAGVFGLLLNAVLIDVFEASKIAYLLWLLVGVTVGVVHLYQNKEIHMYEEIKKITKSSYTIVIILFFLTLVLFGSLLNYYYVSDDFTWLRKIADCHNISNNTNKCFSLTATNMRYFLDTLNLMDEPGIKTYFLFMYNTFWLNQTIYHIVSIFIHFLISVIIFFFAKKIMNNFFLASSVPFIFLILAGYSKSVFFISSTGYLFNTLFILLSLFFYSLWKEKENFFYFALSFISIIISLSFNKFGMIAPILVLIYEAIITKKITLLSKNTSEKLPDMILLLIIPFYIVLSNFRIPFELINHDLVNLPATMVINIISYFLLGLFGSAFLPVYVKMQYLLNEYVLFKIFIPITAIFFSILIYKITVKKMVADDRKTFIFGFLFFVVTLLPFLGLNTLDSTYSYLPSMGLVFIIVLIMKQIYSSLLNNGRNIALASIILLVCIFSIIHLFQLQKTHGDWYEAGEKSRRFILSLNRVYADYFVDKPMQLYFINIPGQYGEAKIFDKGLSDAVWFTFQRNDVLVNVAPSFDFAVAAVKGSINKRILSFKEDGSVEDITPLPETKDIIIK